MKRIIRRMQNLGQRAAELKEALEKLPPKVAEVRQAVSLTKGQLHQLRVDVQSNIAELKADDEESLSGALSEINGSAEVFRQAGYELSGVDLDMGIDRRLKVHFQRVAALDATSLRKLAKANQARKTTHAMLNAFIKAEEMAAQTELDPLEYCALIVQVGSVPAMRLRWRAEEVFEESIEDEVARETPPPMPKSHEPFGKDSFFGPKPASPPPTQVGFPASPPIVPSLAEPIESGSVSGSARSKSDVVSGTKTRRGRREDWQASSLEQFKKNPHYSKYQS